LADEAQYSVKGVIGRAGKDGARLFFFNGVMFFVAIQGATEQNDFLFF
jgi:hypothetical protein